MNDESDISKKGGVRLCSLNFFLKNFCPVCCDSLVSADMHIQKCGRKRSLLFYEKQKRKKPEEKRIRYKSTLCFRPMFYSENT